MVKLKKILNKENLERFLSGIFVAFILFSILWLNGCVTFWGIIWETGL